MPRSFFFILTLFLLSCQGEIQFLSIGSKNEEVITVQKSDKALEEESKITEPVEEPLKYKEYLVTLKANQKRQLDILLVLDISGSMDHHLLKLGSRVLSLLDSISDYDWQIGFTTADHGDHIITRTTNKNKAEDLWEDHINDSGASFGKLMPLETLPIQKSKDSWDFKILDQKILNAGVPNYKDIFFSTVSHFPQKNCDWPPFCQKDLEQPLRALKSAMERSELDNKELFRPKADFVSLIIANEEERQEDPERATTAQEVVSTFNGLLKPLGKRFFAFNILVLDKQCQQSEKLRGGVKTVTANLGLEIGKLADLTGGENISICLEDYGKSLQRMSQIIEVFVEQSVDIEESFIPDSLKVEFLDGKAIPWELVDSRLIFKEKLHKDRKIKISYLPLEP